MRSVVELLNRYSAERDFHDGPEFPMEGTLSGQDLTAVNNLDRPQFEASSEAIKDPFTESIIGLNPPVQLEALSRGESVPCGQTTILYDSVLCQGAAIELSADTTKRKRYMTNNPEDWRRDSPASTTAQPPKGRMTESSNSSHSKDQTGSTSSLLNTHVSIEPDTR